MQSLLHRPALAALLPAVLAAATAAAATGPWHENPQSRVRLVTPYERAPAAGEVRLGLEVVTAPGWHVYWRDSGDAGYPPALDFAPTPQVSAAELRWPAPRRWVLPGPLEALGYEGEVVYPVAARWQAAGARLDLAADLDYVVCEIDCVPYSYRLELAQPLAPAGAAAVPDPVQAPRLASWEARVPRPVERLPGVTTAAVLDLAAPDRPVVEVRVDGAVAGAGGEPAVFLEPGDALDPGIPEPVERRDGALVFRVPVAWRQVPEPVPARLEMGWTVTGVAPARGGDPTALEARRAVAVRRAAAAAPGPPPAPPARGALLGWALLGGLLLDLTPTVLPLLLLGAAAPRDPGRRAAAATTAAGAGLGALLLGAGSVGLGAAGLPVAWGDQLRAPPVLALLVVAVTVEALALWGLLAGPPRHASAPPGRAAAGLRGLAVASLALAWTPSPVLRSLGTLAGAPAGTVLAGYAALGLGLALPWLALAAVAGRAARGATAPEPRGGRRLAEALGFVAAAAAVWLLYLLSRQVTSDGLALVELALLALALVAWARHAAGRRRALALALALALLLLAAAIPWLADSRRLQGAAAAPPAASRLVATRLQPSSLGG